MGAFDDLPDEKQGDGLVSKVGSDIAAGGSKLLGVLVGTANAPLAFVQGMQNAPIQSPEEWGKLPWYQKPLVMLGGGLESAGRSALKEGDWGEQYDTYYTAKTGSTLEKDFGPTGGPTLRFGLDLMRDPMFGPALGVDLAKKGVTTAGQFLKYLKTGATEQGAKEIAKIPKGMAEDIATADAGIYAMDEAEKQVLKQRLSAILEKKQAGDIERLKPLVEEVYGAGAVMDDGRIAGAEQMKRAGVSELNGPNDVGTSFMQTDFANRFLPSTEVKSGITYTEEEAAAFIKATREELLSKANRFEGGIGGPIPLADLDPKLDRKVNDFLIRGYFPDKTKFRSFFGSALGIEQDEEGNWSYDPAKGALGMAGGAAALGFGSKIGQGKAFQKMFKNASPEAQKVASMYDDTVVARIKRESTSFEKVKAAVVRAVTDVSGNMKSDVELLDPTFGREVRIQKDLIAGANNRASSMLTRYNDAIFKGIDSQDTELLNTIIQSRRTLEVEGYKPGIKSSGGLGVEHQKYLDELETIIGQEKYADLNGRADIYFDSMLDQLEMKMSEGIISQEQYQALSKHIYSPRVFLQHLDDLDAQFGTRPLSSGKSGISALDEGSTNLMENRADLLLTDVVARTQNHIFTNRANVALMDFAEANPGNGIVELAKIKSYTQAGKPVYAEAPTGWQKVSVMSGGERKEMILPNEYAQEWIKNDPLVNQTFANIMGWLLGSKEVKAFATGYNPVFALSNIPRDVALVWGATTEYSAHLPVAMGQMARDFAAVAGDVFSRKGRVLEYVDQGGGMEFMTYYGRFKGQGEIGEKINTLGKILGWVGETSEIWTRMALRERALRNGKSARDATWTARNYLDFSQGGSIAKAIDIGIPYFNAAIQGTRSMLRGAETNPATFAYKMGQLGALSTGLYMANYLTNPEVWKNVSDREKEANFIITTPYSYTDKDGQKRDLYFKIAKDQGQRVITSLFEASMAKVMEGKLPTKQVLLALSDLGTSSFVPPRIAQIIAYAANKDTWSMDDVWRGPEVEPEQEFNAGTHPFAVGVGKVTGISPERFTAAVGKTMPLNNFFVGMVGGGVRAITNALSPEDDRRTREEMILSNSAVNRFLSKTSPLNQYRDDIEQTRIGETSRRYEQAREVDKLAAAYFQSKDDGVRGKLIDFIENQPPEDQERLTNRVVHYSETAQLPDRAWWVSVSSLPPTAKAESFLKRFSGESPEGQMRMITLAEKITGFSSSEFVEELAKRNRK